MFESEQRCGHGREGEEPFSVNYFVENCRSLSDFPEDNHYAFYYYREVTSLGCYSIAGHSLLLCCDQLCVSEGRIG